MKQKLANWGKHPAIEAEVFTFDFTEELQKLLPNISDTIARGNGRCYGDASLAKDIVSTLRFNKVLGLNTEEGWINCQSGVLLSDILEIILPEGWFLPVTPGTKFISVGGAVASDVHGKNHHKEGSFSNHIREMEILCSDGQIISCSRELNGDLFNATCGGMGLTGMILSVKFNLKKVESTFIDQIQVKARDLDEIMDLFIEYKHHTYSMAWIDCLKGGRNFGRSIMMAGEHSTHSQSFSKSQNGSLALENSRRFTVPFDFPSAVLNPFSVKLFNELYYHKNYKKLMNSQVYFDSFFYPLDSILHWNKMYGPKGFLQYQFVIPFELGKQGLTKILNKIRENGSGSFLAVLKLFGDQDDLISFPMKGYTLALDFPIRQGLFKFLDHLDKIVLDYGGRIYMSKDARMSSDIFWKSYPRAHDFVDILKRYNPDGRFSSIQSKRLSII